MARRGLRPGVCLALLCAAALGQEIRDFPSVIRNWSAPPFWSSTEAGGERSAASPADALATGPTSPLPFIGITPCRIVDTRSAAFPSGYGPPSMAANVSRNFTLAGQCGIPSTAQAVSLNVTVTGTQGNGYILIYPVGGGAPGVSTLNYVAGQTVANAAIVPLGSAGDVTAVAVVSGAQLILDTNGYYGASGTGASNTFLGANAGNFTMTGDGNTAVGALALTSNTTGASNTANGMLALRANTTGSSNTAIGSFALAANIAGVSNTANGYAALNANTTGGLNAALGIGALRNNTEGGSNTAVGAAALEENTTAYFNTAVGGSALGSNVTGADNAAVGYGALSKNVSGSSNAGFGLYALWQSTGSRNIGLGNYAGTNLTSGDNNLYLGNEALDGESNTIRIGSGGSGFFQAHTRFFAAGIYGTNVGFSSAVMVNAIGQLGTVTSSARYKEEIHDMGAASDRLLKLRPVSFRYKGQPEAPVQFGLIAEEVEKVLPELVGHSPEGEAQTVFYHELPAMLVNELQKQEKRIEEQEREIGDLRARLASLEAGRRGSRD